MDLGLKGKSVVVMASSKGLGRAIATNFVTEGANVLISSRDEEELQKTRDEIITETGQNKINYVVCDMTSGEDIQQMMDKAVKLNGTIDVLVNNTGGPPAGNFDKVNDNDWQSAFELNLLSFTRTIRAVLPHMRESGKGHIINIASSSIKEPIDNLILSNTFRAGIVGLSKSLSQELAQDNILINTVAPGRIATGRVEHLDQVKADMIDQTYDEIRTQSEQSIPLGRYGEPREFANMVVYLCSEANSYVTGQAILVDGGMVKAL